MWLLVEPFVEEVEDAYDLMAGVLGVAGNTADGNSLSSVNSVFINVRSSWINHYRTRGRLIPCGSGNGSIPD